MGAGVGLFERRSQELYVNYDEVIVVLEGTFRLKLGKDFSETLEAAPGDVIWLPEHTPLRYEGDGAKVFYALYPVDWRKRHAL
jgi:ethanolamine utilization protein EutQ